MRAGPVVIGQLFQNRYRYCVPIYQRHFVWNREKQWEPFWSDIRTKAVERLNGRERRFSHFMGAVVLERRGDFAALKVPSFQVVDGQQRLTAYQLFLAATRDYAKDAGFESVAQQIQPYLFNRDPHLMEDSNIEIFKVWPTQYDRELFVDILTFADRGKLREKYPQHFYKTRDEIYDNPDTPRLIAAYGFFYDRVREAAETEEIQDELYLPVQHEGGLPPEAIVNAIWQSLIEEFKVVEIILDEGDDAQVIFETLNERGEPLLAADLVRNNIFHRADGAGENAEGLFATYWKVFEDPFWSREETQGRTTKPRIEFFLANYIAGKIADEVNLTKLFSEYKAFVDGSTFESVEHELQELDRFSSIYHELVGRAGNSPLSRFSKRLAPWEVTTVNPLVLRLWAATEMDTDEKAEALNVLYSFIVRRAVCNLTTKNYNRFFLNVIHHLDNSSWSRDNLVAYFLAQTSDISRFPRDEEFERRWTANPLYRMLTRARMRSILTELELAKRTSYHEVSEIVEDLTIEHIMPNEWEMNWPLPNGEVPDVNELTLARHAGEEEESRLGQIVRRDRLKHSIGNLTLLTQPFNSSVSNGAWDTKREAFDRHSLLVLNREITEHENWDEDAIIERSHALFGFARWIWSFPELDEATLEETG